MSRTVITASAAQRKLADELASHGVIHDVPQIVVSDDEPVIEPITESDLADVARDEAFMNERIKIRVHTTTDPNAPPFVTVTVNSPTNRVQIPRGRVVEIKRCFVEVLARMRETRYTQPTRNPMDPESGNEMIGHSAIVYPFEIVGDPNPRGRAWLERILGED
jgi:hypothetical protein